MERSWERRVPWFEVGREQVEGLVAAALPGARVAAVEPLSGGLRNANYRVEVDARPSLVLRFYTADASACGREVAVLRRVAGLVPAPDVVAAAPDADPPWALLTWLDGTPLDEVLAAPTLDERAALALADACGSALARIHSVGFERPGFLDASLGVTIPLPSWSETVETFAAAEPVAARIGARRTAGVRRTVKTWAETVDRVLADEAVLCQGDFKPWNLLARVPADRPARLTGVIDWEFAFAGHPLFDFATFFRHPGLRGPFTDAFAEAYVDAGGRLGSDWANLARLVDLINLLQLIESGGERQVDDLLALLDETIRSF